jgi:hypothetical protein
MLTAGLPERLPLATPRPRPAALRS